MSATDKRTKAMLIDGKTAAADILDSIANRLKDCTEKPCLAVVRAGNDPASTVYIKQKARACARVGMECRIVELPEDATNYDLINTLLKLDQDPDVDGIIVQLPLPSQIEQSCISLISQVKDVDGLGWENKAALWNRTSFSYHEPCTPSGIMRLLGIYRVPVDGASVCIIGRSDLVGLPLAAMMLRRNATVTICHSHTADLDLHTRTADIVVAAAGRPGLVTADMIKAGATVIDAGINRVNGSLCGDCDSAVAEVAGLITPVPGGVGPMTVAELINNTYTAYLTRRNRKC